MRDDPWLEAFYAKIGAASDDACWPWLGATDEHGRGNVSIEGKKRLATHVALQISGHPRSEGMSALHKCDNPNCVNPQHLWWGTQAQNIADMVAKGRANAPKGSSNAFAKLTDEIVRAIRMSDEPNKVLALRYGIDRSKISRIKNGKAWQHVSD